MGLSKFDKQQSQGLAALLPSAGESLSTSEVRSPQTTSEDVSAVVAYILDSEDSIDISRLDGYLDVACMFERRLSSLAGTAGTSGRAEGEQPKIEPDNVEGSSSTSGDANSAAPKPTTNGRLGPPKVSLDRASVSGQFTYSDGGLALESLANFSSCRANVCCFKGKWMYEVTLGTAGIQQVGWATLNCPFTSEEGVGDAPDSYAYDGKRVKKWNEKCSAYGVSWAPNDVIGCCLDLDTAQITFYRNGSSLGTAFENIRTLKPSLAYFPAVSLSQNEKCELNFGSRPFLYPVDGFQALQAAPSEADQQTAAYLLSCLQRLVRIVAGSEDWEASNVLMPRASLPWDDAVLLANLLAQKLGSLLMQEYMVQSHFLPFLLELHHKREPHRSNCVLAAISLLQLNLPSDFFQFCVPVLMQALSLRSRTSLSQPAQFPYTASYPYLALAATLLQNNVTREVWLQQRDFHLILEGFLTRKQQTPDDLKTLIPHVWWPGIKDSPSSEEQLKSTTQALTVALSKIEDKQFELVAALTSGSTSTNNSFLDFLEYLLSKNQGATRDIQPPGLSDSTVLSSLFFVLLRMLQPYLQAAASGEGALASFSAAKLFVQTSEADAGNVMTELGRLGGVVSHLQREIQLKAEDWKPCDVRPPAALHQVPTAPAKAWLPDSCLAQLLNTAMVLYSWRISVSIKMAQNCASQMKNAITAMAEIERHIERNPNRVSEFQRYAADLKEEAATNLRYLTQLKVGLLSGWKQEGLFNLAAYVSTLLLYLAEGERALLCYVPVCYMDCVLDCLHGLRKVTPPFATPAQLLPAGLGSMLSLLMYAFNSKAIANPDVKETVLQTTTLLLDSEEFREAMEATPVVRSSLVPATVECFDSRLWHASSNILLRLVKGSGLGQGPHPPSLPVFQAALRDVCSTPASSFQPFMNRLFNTLNWAITEVSVTVSELSDNRAGRNSELMQQQTRKTATLMDLSANLLRILEFVVCQSPKAFLTDVSLNLARLLELVAFLLCRYPKGPDARKLADLMRPSQRTSPYMEKVSVPQVLAPVLGLLLGLWHADTDSETHVLMAQLAHAGGGGVADVLPALKEVEWTTTFPDDPSLPQQLEDFQQMAEQVREAHTQWEAAQPQPGSSEEEIPEEFLDPITMTVMADPVVLPDSQVTVDRTTIQRHLLSQATDPFSRKELSLGMVQPNTDLAEKIKEWKQASSGKAAVKKVLDDMDVD